MKKLGTLIPALLIASAVLLFPVTAGASSCPASNTGLAYGNNADCASANCLPGDNGGNNCNQGDCYTGDCDNNDCMSGNCRDENCPRNQGIMGGSCPTGNCGSSNQGSYANAGNGSSNQGSYANVGNSSSNPQNLCSGGNCSSITGTGNLRNGNSGNSIHDLLQYLFGDSELGQYFNRWLEGAGGSNGANSPITYPQQQGQAGVNAYAQAVVNLVNQERAKGNLPALALDQSLMQAAQIRVTEIMESFSHTRPDGSACFTVLQQVGARYSKAGENIAIGQSSPEDVVKAWMASPGHRANIMSAEYGRIGVGAAASQNSKYSGYAWTQFFAD